MTRMKYNIIYLSGGRQKSYLAVASRVILRPPEELSGVRQNSYEGKSKINESFLI